MCPKVRVWFGLTHLAEDRGGEASQHSAPKTDGELCGAIEGPLCLIRHRTKGQLVAELVDSELSDGVGDLPVMRNVIQVRWRLRTVVAYGRRTCIESAEIRRRGLQAPLLVQAVQSQSLARRRSGAGTLVLSVSLRVG